MFMVAVYLFEQCFFLVHTSSYGKYFMLSNYVNSYIAAFADDIRITKMSQELLMLSNFC